MDTVNQSGGGERVIEVMHEAMHLFRAERHRQAEASGLPLAHMEAKALGFFARHPGATLSGMVSSVGRDKSQLAKLIATLRERGLLEAEPDEADRRSVRLQLTAAGRDLLRQWKALDRRRARAAVAGLSPAECETLVALLSKVRDNLREASG